MRRELEQARELGKIVVVSMGAYAASGGYYIATAADKIVAQPGTITGSIGAFFGKLNLQVLALQALLVQKVQILTKALNLQKLFSHVGIDVDEIALGKDANFLNPALPLSASQRSKCERSGRKVYDDFVALVAAARHLTDEQVDALARGRVWTGAQAQTLGLVDELGGLGRAHRLAADLCGMTGGKDAKLPPLVEYPKALSIEEQLLRALMGQGKGEGLADTGDGTSLSSSLSSEHAPLPSLARGSGVSDVWEVWTHVARMGVEMKRFRELGQSQSVSLYHYED